MQLKSIKEKNSRIDNWYVIIFHSKKNLRNEKQISYADL